MQPDHTYSSPHSHVNGNHNAYRPNEPVESLEEMEQLRALVRQLRDQNRHLLQRQQQQHNPMETSQMNRSSILSQVLSDSFYGDNMSLSSRLSAMEGGAADDTCSVLSLSMTTSQVFQSPSMQNSTAMPHNQSHSANQPSHGAHEDCWLYRPPQPPRQVRDDPPSANEPEKWMRQVFDSPNIPRKSSAGRDTESLVRKLDELRLLGRVNRWASSTTLSAMSMQSMGTDNDSVTPTEGNSPRLEEHSNKTAQHSAEHHPGLRSPPIKEPLLPVPRLHNPMFASASDLSTITQPRDREPFPRRESAPQHEPSSPPPVPLVTTDVLEIARRQQESLRAHHQNVLRQSKSPTRAPVVGNGSSTLLIPASKQAVVLPAPRTVPPSAVHKTPHQRNVKAVPPTPKSTGIVHEEFV